MYVSTNHKPDIAVVEQIKTQKLSMRILERLCPVFAISWDFDSFTWNLTRKINIIIKLSQELNFIAVNEIWLFKNLWEPRSLMGFTFNDYFPRLFWLIEDFIETLLSFIFSDPLSPSTFIQLLVHKRTGKGNLNILRFMHLLGDVKWKVEVSVIQFFAYEASLFKLNALSFKSF